MKHSQERGFTLIEIVIVVFIAGIVVTMASLSFNASQGPREVRQFTEQLAQKLKLASQVAELLPGEFGFANNANTLQFYQLITNEGLPYWNAIVNMSMLKPQQLPHSIELTIESGNFNLIAEENNSPFYPAIQFFSNGNITPFQITIYDSKQPSNPYIIVGNLAGEIRLA